MASGIIINFRNRTDYKLMDTLKINRIKSIDLLRGFVMIIMALDHTRDYFNADAFLFNPLDLDKTNVLLFFTRWITHFCAPIFVLLAGTSAFISGQRKTKKDLSAFLIKRGLWLIFLELTVVNFSWFFNIRFSFILLAVIWTLGVCMISLAVLLFLPKKIIFAIGVILVASHNLLDRTHFPDNNTMGFVWGFLHDQKMFTIGNLHIFMAYPILPWIGVMALGYCLGSLFTPEYSPVERKRILVRLGFMSILLFIILRSINIYGNIIPWSKQPTILFSFLSFINISKYPPSLDYLLLTVGFGLVFLGLTENISNRLSKFISVYGRVPMFYYLIHIYLIHLLAMLAAVLSGYKWTDMTGFTTWISYMPNLKGYGFSLGVVYLIWISVVLVLYPLCKKYDRYKSTHKDIWWLSYL
jgi:uncharacterized membrane protein